MRLSIVTINYNSSESTIKLLKSLAEQTDMDFQIFVVDNASEETDFKILSNFVNETTSQVVLLRNKENLGFSGGNNVGIKEALKSGADPAPSLSAGRHLERGRAWSGASWVLLLNNDAWVENDFISHLKANLEGLEGIAGIPVEDKGGIAYCGRIRWLKKPGDYRVHVYNASEAGSIKNKFAIGAAMAVHKDVFDKIGFLDENYFLYYEDNDFSVRARKANLNITILQFALVHHEQFGSSKKLGRPLLMRYHYRNDLYFNWKNGPWYIKLLVWPWSWMIIFKQILKIMIYHNREESVAIFKGVFDFYRNKMGKI